MSTNLNAVLPPLNAVETFYFQTKIGILHESTQDPSLLPTLAACYIGMGLSALVASKIAPKCDNRLLKTVLYTYAGVVFGSTLVGVAGIVIQLQQKGLDIWNLKAAGRTLKDCQDICHLAGRLQWIQPCPTECLPFMEQQPSYWKWSELYT